MKVGVRSLLFAKEDTHRYRSFPNSQSVTRKKNCQNFERKRDFGGFQLREVRKNKVKVTRFVYFCSHFVAKNII